MLICFEAQRGGLFTFLYFTSVVRLDLSIFMAFGDLMEDYTPINESSPDNLP